MSLRTGGREAVEDTPVTGATEETAADHIALAIQSEIDYDPIWCRGMAREITERLESEGYAIVRAEDALTAEQKMAWGELLDAANPIAFDQYHDREGWNRVSPGRIETLVEAATKVTELGGLTADELRAIAAGGTE